ncbi:MAG: hypothetical protein WCL49_11085 [bacterium]
MIWRCCDSLLVLAAFAAVYIIPPLLVVGRLRLFTDRTTLFVVSAGLGLTSQALLGFIWNHFMERSPALEGILYFLFWLTTSLILLVWRKNTSPEINNQQSTINNLLPLILLAAVILRSIDALTHASLGQSDAYTHLQFLRDAVQNGTIRNFVYPPGYSWVLALPVMTFHLDAYLVARYVGPFFGVLMVATLYLLGRRHSHPAGLLAAFFAAVCPFLYPLIKTGMGAFANQLGLYLLPLALLLYLIKARFLFTVILAGLAVTVPLFVFTLLLLILMHRIVSWREDAVSRGWWRETMLTLLPFILAFALAGYHFLTYGEHHINTTASMVTGIQTPTASPPTATHESPDFLTTLKRHPAGKLVVDLLTFKRPGLGSWMPNLAALTLGAAFIGLIVFGFRTSSKVDRDLPATAGSDAARRSASTIGCLVGGWGFLTLFQVFTGFLEFSLYQRSGWILLQAIALAGGLIVAEILKVEKTQKLIRPVLGMGLLICLIFAFGFPPRHRCITSGAEHELATVLRELSSARIQALHSSAPRSFEKLHPSPLILHAAATPGLAVITRRYSLFNGDQGNLSDALPDPAARIRQIPVETDTRLTPPSDHFLCLIDRFSGLPDMGLLDSISPELTHALAGYQPLLYKPNEVILAFLATLPATTWQITREDRGQNLTVYFVERLHPKVERKTSPLICTDSH